MKNKYKIHILVLILFVLTASLISIFKIIETKECNFDKDCKLIYSSCECEATNINNERTHEDDGRICIWNSCYGMKVKAICKHNKCIRNDKQ